MNIIKVNTKPFYGNYKRVLRQAEEFHKTLIINPKKIPYIRCPCFHNEKVFLNIFWKYLRDKIRPDRRQRLQYYACAIDLLRIKNINLRIYMKKGEGKIFYRFQGEANNQKFAVQVKERGKKRKQRYLISIFPTK